MIVFQLNVKVNKKMDIILRIFQISKYIEKHPRYQRGRYYFD